METLVVVCIIVTVGRRYPFRRAGAGTGSTPEACSTWITTRGVANFSSRFRRGGESAPRLYHRVQVTSGIVRGGAGTLRLSFSVWIPRYGGILAGHAGTDPVARVD